jgi:transposase
MVKKIVAQNEKIVIGVDVSDSKHNAAVVRVRGGEIIRDDRMDPDFEAWTRYFRKFPGCDVTVVYESGPQGYNLYDAIKRLGCKAVVIAPVKHIGVKTDKRDARSIARDYLAGSAKVVTVPDNGKRELRQVLRSRAQYMKELMRVRNRTRALIRFHGLTGLLAPWRRGEVSPHLQFCLDALNANETFLVDMIKTFDKKIEQMAEAPQLKPTVEKLTRIKGIGAHTALDIVLEVADIAKFKNSDAFASYTGLCPGEWSSGETRRQGHITRRGPGRLRGALVRSAWTQVRCDAEEKKRFEALAARIGKKRAIVAAARRLAVTIWWTLKEDTARTAA